MRFLETFVESPWAGAIGWTLLDSLWQGAMAAALLGTVLLATRSPRVRYAAACLGLLGMLAAFSATLFELAPAAGRGAVAVKVLALPAWRVPAAASAAAAWNPSLAAAAPWLAPLWLTGLLISYSRYAVSIFSLQRFRRRGVCAAAECWQQKLTRLSATVTGFAAGAVTRILPG